MEKIDVRKLYEADGGWGWYDYTPMIEAFGKVAIRIDDHGYQGDSRILYDNDGKIGYLLFGWGSCSGCDALQACDDLDDIQKLCDDLQGMIKWFESKEEALTYFREHDWDGDYSWWYDETKEFVAKVIAYLEGKENEGV
jgi:hypothetical protein